MKKEYLEKLVERGMSTRDIAKEIGKSQGSIRHWLKKYKLITKARAGRKVSMQNTGMKKCGFCSEVKKETEFSPRKRGGLTGYCISCMHLKNKSKGIERKKKLLELKGSCCQFCGYDKNMAALGFHHVDPETKSFSLDMRNLKAKSWNLIIKELSKCILLCANCHMEEHYPEYNL